MIALTDEEKSAPLNFEDQTIMQIIKENLAKIESMWDKIIKASNWFENNLKKHHLSPEYSRNLFKSAHTFKEILDSMEECKKKIDEAFDALNLECSSESNPSVPQWI